ncbi:MAG: Gfo/Idh/MocA family oxidoreductase [Planctomycetota bacterium]|nr:Gfo/Idh/MocA family oxidoreductase [Planctomycetota bacterium]
MAARQIPRRTFLTRFAVGAATVSIVPRSVLGGPGQVPPSERIGLGFVGVGRICQGHLSWAAASPDIHVVAVCDLDSNRLEAARKKFADCVGCGDYRELLARNDIDAVLIATPDHWHVPVAVHAARAGKDIYVEKPLSLTIAEGRILSDTVRRYGRVLQVGSQQRSDTLFRHACELVRNGKIGELKTIQVGISGEPQGKLCPPEPVPQELNYEMWLGQAPFKPYTENRVHPRKGFDRPGWLRILDYGSGMITGWGAHHLDIAQWGLGTETSGPVEIIGTATFPKDGIWDVAMTFHMEYTYPRGVKMICDSSLPNGVRFEGTDGWVFITRGSEKAGNEALLKWVAGPKDIHLYRSTNHHGNFVECIRTRRDPIASVEIGHRSATMCHLGHIATLVNRTLRWDPVQEHFIDDPEADRLLSRPMREPWRL